MLAAAVVIGIGLWLVLNRTRVGVMIRAGVDDRADAVGASGSTSMSSSPSSSRSAPGLPVSPAVVGGTALSIAPGEDVRYLLASLVVVIVGGMGSITGAAIGALLIGLAEQVGLVYFPTYGIVLTFLIMVVVLAFRPQGIMGQAGMSALDRHRGAARDRWLRSSGIARRRWSCPAPHRSIRLVASVLPGPDRRLCR